MAHAVSRESVSGLTLVTEDAVEGILAGLRWWRHGDLDVHELGPSGVSVDAESLNSILNSVVQLVDVDIELWHHDQDGNDCEC